MSEHSHHFSEEETDNKAANNENQQAQAPASAFQRTVTYVPAKMESHQAAETVPFLKKLTTLIGIGLDRIVLADKDSKVEEMLLCSICDCILRDPKECNQCDQGFCNQCIQNWLVTGQGKGHDCPDFKPKNAHKLLLASLKRLELKCDNSELGCPASVLYGEMDAHLDTCEFSTCVCPNYGCNEEMLLKTYQDHLKTCEHHVRKCDKCASVLKENHDCIASLVARFDVLEKSSAKIT
jgi:hypothetical protein